MLGNDGKPFLLVNVEENYNPKKFEFYVINGAWDGIFIDGYLTINHPWHPFSSLDKVQIICTDQKRLRSHPWDYQDVFNNFDNPNYVGPEPKPIPEDFLDDIAF